MTIAMMTMATVFPRESVLPGDPFFTLGTTASRFLAPGAIWMIVSSVPGAV